jgi:hypothetical protein
MISKEIIQGYLDLGFSIVPVDERKLPFDGKTGRLLEWGVYQQRQIENNGYFAGGWGLAVICGRISGNVECLDIDIKNDTTGELWEQLSKEIEDNLPDVEFVIQKTYSGGYHYFYRCKEIEGNQVFAKNKEGKPIIETRGEGGYAVVAPSPRYKLIKNKFSSVPTITPEQRDALFNICRSFNEYVDERSFVKPAPKQQVNTGLKSPFDDYNERGDGYQILINHGWQFKYKKGDKVFLTTPNSKSKAPHATYNHIPNCFYPFTTNSGSFETGKAYNHSAIFCKLECNDDWKECYKKLYEMGYGERKIANREGLVKAKVNQRIFKATSLIRGFENDKDFDNLLLAGSILGNLVGGNHITKENAEKIISSELKNKLEVSHYTTSINKFKEGLEYGIKNPISETDLINEFNQNISSFDSNSDNKQEKPKTESNRNMIGKKVREPLLQYPLTHSKVSLRIANTIYHIINEGYVRDVQNKTLLDSKKDFKPLDNTELNTLLLECQGLYNTTVETFDKVIESNYIPTMDFLLDLQEGCEDEKDYEGSIDALFESLILETPIHTQQIRDLFKKWLIGFWANLLGDKPEDVNQLMLVLVGGNHIGKSHFFKHLFFEIGFSENKIAILQEDIHKNITDLKRFSREMLFCFFDDFEEGLMKNDYFFKSILSNKYISMVDKFEKNASNHRRIANFAGTTNKREFLFETAYNRRIIPIHIKDRDYAQYDSVDKLKVFAEAYNLYKQGKTHQVTKEEIAFIKIELSSKAKVTTMLSDVILSKFLPANKGDEGAKFLTSTEIYNHFDGLKIPINLFGQEIRKLGFGDSREKVKGTYGYYVTFNATD